MKIKSMEEIGERIRQLRIEKGITLTQLSVLAKVSKGTLSKLENGKAGDMGIMTLQRIAKWTGGL
jgi:transcriptional regulator with XRE-family HTH domain